MNILLCCFEESSRGLSVRYLSSFLKAKEHDVKLLFFNIKKTSEFTSNEISEIVKFIKDNKIEWLGISIMTESFFLARDLSRKLKNIIPSIKIVLGGVHATVCPEECLNTDADFIVMGNGERPLEKLVSGEDPETIHGIAFKKQNHIVKNPALALDFLDLDRLPFPDWELEGKYFLKGGKIEKLDMKTFREGNTWKASYYPMITTRGCIYHCSYCNNVNKNLLKRNSVGRAMEELEYIKKVLPFTRGVNIQDDSFFMGNDKYLTEFCKELKKRFG